MNDWDQEYFVRYFRRQAEQAFLGGEYGSPFSSLRRVPISLSAALAGDDRPAPDGDAWETEMLHLLARG